MLYTAGAFALAGDTAATNVARWDGTNWSALGTGVNGVVWAIAVRGPEVFVGGSFTAAGGTPVNNIAKWDGTNWSALGAGIVPVEQQGEWVGAVHSLAVDADTLYVAGRFRSAGGLSATNVARWDGSGWHTLRDGLRYLDGPWYENGSVDALALIDGYLYAGGGFYRAGDVAATNIARWNGTTWSAVGSGVNDYLGISALTANGTDLMAGGVFRSIGGVKADRIARWDGEAWFPLGSGIGGQSGDGVSTLASTGSELYVGGYFPLAGGKPATNIALWHVPHALSIGRSGDAVTLSWPATGTNFVLEAEREASGTNWSEVSPPATVLNNECVVTNAIDVSQRFYRLRRK